MDVNETSSSFGIRAYLYTRLCSDPSESVNDHKKTNVFTTNSVIVIMGNVRVGTLSLSGIMSMYYHAVLIMSKEHGVV